jgi:hypothetical protein
VIKCFDVLLVPTAYIFRVNKLVQMDAKVMQTEGNVFSCMGRFEGVRRISAAEGKEDRAVNIKKDSAPCSYDII